MNRTERLTALLLLLQSRRDRLTAQEIADHFGISRRTALRDMAALAAMGVPVQSTDGANGGYSLPEDFTPASLPLNLREAMLLLLALSGLEKLAAAPFGDTRTTLIAKLRALLAPKQLGAADALLGKIALEVPDRSAHPAPFLDILLTAAQTGRWIAARYYSESAGDVTERTLLPTRLSSHGGFWYVEAHTHERNGEQRTYRADRFAAATFCEPPPDAHHAFPQTIRRGIIPKSMPSSHRGASLSLSGSNMWAAQSCGMRTVPVRLPFAARPENLTGGQATSCAWVPTPM